MKKCPMCGSAAADDAAICFECLYSFARMSCIAMGSIHGRPACAHPLQAEAPGFSDFEVAVDDPESGFAVYPLSSGSLTIGRLSTNDIVFSDLMVSRRHLRIFVEQGQVWAEVLGAKNAPRLNGEPFRGRVVIAPEDVIGIRQATLRLVGRDGVDDTIA